MKTRVGFLPRQKVFLPGQWKKTVKTGNNRRQLAKSVVHKTGYKYSAAYSDMLILDEKRAPCLLDMTSKLKQLKMSLNKCKKNQNQYFAGD